MNTLLAADHEHAPICGGLDRSAIDRLTAAFDDPRNTAAAALLTFTGVRTVTGIVALLISGTADDRELVSALVRAALDQHEQLA